MLGVVNGDTVVLMGTRKMARHVQLTRPLFKRIHDPLHL